MDMVTKNTMYSTENMFFHLICKTPNFILTSEYCSFVADSQKWQSSLMVEKVLNIASVNKMITDEKVKTQHYT